MSYSSASPVSIFKLFSASCRPPPLRCSPDAAAADWVLLEPLAYVADRTNAATAEAISSAGYSIQATFCAADPPGVSCVCIHCPDVEEADFPERPRIICSDKDLLLLRVTFKFRPYDEAGLREYFLYKAGPGRPSLHLLPDPLPFVARAWEVGLVPHGDDGHFVLAALCFTQAPWVYDLQLFSSTTWTWSTKVASADMSDKVNSRTQPEVVHKVISLGGGTLGWVDLWRGILLCNVLDEVSVVQVIQLPMLMPGNKGGLRVCPWNIRDIACSDGLIKLVEVETYIRQVDEAVYHNMLVVYDSDLLAVRPVRDNVGWRIITWYRMSSWNYWRKECMYYDEEISVDHSRHQIGDGGRELALKNVSASFPVLSSNCHCDDTVYLLCNLKSDTQKVWLVTVDLKMKQLIDLAPFSIEGYFSPAYPCQLSKYLKGALASAGSLS